MAHKRKSIILAPDSEPEDDENKVPRIPVVDEHVSETDEDEEKSPLLGGYYLLSLIFPCDSICHLKSNLPDDRDKKKIIKILDAVIRAKTSVPRDEYDQVRCKNLPLKTLWILYSISPNFIYIMLDAAFECLFDLIKRGKYYDVLKQDLYDFIYCELGLFCCAEKHAYNVGHQQVVYRSIIFDLCQLVATSETMQMDERISVEALIIDMFSRSKGDTFTKPMLDYLFKTTGQIAKATFYIGCKTYFKLCYSQQDAKKICDEVSKYFNWALVDIQYIFHHLSINDTGNYKSKLSQ